MSFLRILWQRLIDNDCAGLSAEIAYHWMLAFLPAMVFVFDVFGLFSADPALFKLMLTQLRHLVPAEAFGLLQSTLSELIRGSSEGLALTSFLAALWTGSNGAMVVEKALNLACCRKESRRNFWQRRLVAFGIVLGLALILFVFSNLLVFGGLMIIVIQEHLQPPEWILSLLVLARWGIPLVGLLMASAFIYFIAPENPEKWSWRRILPGTLTFSVMWVMISWLFSLYVSNMGSYNKVYGAMGAMIILMFWLYLTSFALLTGGEVNALTWDRQISPATQGDDSG